MKTYYEEIKAYIECCSDIQVPRSDQNGLAEIGVDQGDGMTVMLNLETQVITFCEDQTLVLALAPNCRVTAMFNQIFEEIQPLG